MATRAGAVVPQNTTGASTVVPAVQAPPYFAPLNNGYEASGLAKKQSG